jgi:nucleoside-diphosphate-sugar epimerase
MNASGPSLDPVNRVLVTGAGGFVGNILCPLLVQAGYVVRAAVRTDRGSPMGTTENVIVGDVGGHTDWTAALCGVDLVIHLAARAHVMNGAAAADGYLETNARGTQRLAVESARNGIHRLVYLSSVKVNGEESEDRAYSAADVPHPLDAYGLSKWRGEQFLAETAARTRMQAVVVRSPLVYGAGVHANFLRLLYWVDRERLLPLGAIRNRRSLASVWSLCDLLMRVLTHPAAPGGTWMVSDGEDVSTPELVLRIARAMGRRARLLRVPVPLLHLAGGLLGQGEHMRRLCGSLTVDITPTRTRLGWSPPVSMDEALARTVSWYQSQRQRPK